MSGFVNTFQLIEDKLADIIRTEFGGYSVYFDDEYLNRKTKYFNIKNNYYVRKSDEKKNNIKVYPLVNKRANIF